MRQGHHLRQWRKFRGLTQEQLAERMGVGRTRLTKIEAGKLKYDQGYLEVAAEALRCTVADLIMRDPTDPQGLWSIYDDLNPTERVQLVEIAKTLKRTGTEG